jgi:hypothetical protein
VYWCERCATEIPAAEVYTVGTRLMHRRGSDAGMLHGDEHEVVQLRDTHEPLTG